MDPQPDDVIADGAHLGHHVVSIAADANEQLDLVARVFAAGLSSECACLYIADRTAPRAVIAGLQRRGCEVEGRLESGQLTLTTADDVYLPDGYFDPDRMLARVADAIDDARNAGFRGLCATGELSWLGRRVPGSDRLLEYEFRLNSVEGLESAAVVCLYEPSSLVEQMDHELEKMHPFVHQDGEFRPSATHVADPDYLTHVPLVEELEPAADSLPCTWLAELISADADRAVLERRRAEIARHVATCRLCGVWVEEVRGLKRGARALRRAAPVPDGFWQTVSSRLRPPNRSR
jgi:hypothetical protein